MEPCPDFQKAPLEVAREPHTAQERSQTSRLSSRLANTGANWKLAPGVISGNLQSERLEVAMADYASLLRDHVTLNCRSIDRIFLQAYVPKLQTVGEVCTFLRWQRKFPIPSSAAFGKIGEEYVKAVYRFAEAHHIPVVHFKKGQDKEAVARPYLEAAA